MTYCKVTRKILLIPLSALNRQFYPEHGGSTLVLEITQFLSPYVLQHPTSQFSSFPTKQNEQNPPLEEIISRKHDTITSV
jgi:hypothetical protein